MLICVPVTPEGLVDPRWGRAGSVAIAQAGADGIAGWQLHDVRWDVLHDEGTEGSHHARVARFLLEHKVEAVVAGHMGPPMVNMLERMRINVWLEADGDARAAVVEAIRRHSV
jgi:predicted Fe-Mo cluster-binding NifX family protein